MTNAGVWIRVRKRVRKRVRVKVRVRVRVRWSVKVRLREVCARAGDSKVYSKECTGMKFKMT